MATTTTEVSVNQEIALEKEVASPAASVPVQIGTHFFRQKYLFAFATQAEVLQYLRTQTLSEELARLPEIFSAWQEVQPRVADRIGREAGIVVQELLRHANSRITLDIYTQALTPAKREAQSRVANLILPKKTMVGESLTNPFKPSLSEAGSANS